MIVDDFNVTCQICSKDADVFEVLDNDDPEGTDLQIWCYCTPCDAETFHDYEEA